MLYENYKIKNKNIRDMLYIIAGSLIYGIGMNLFIKKYGLLSGGVNGISLILFYITKIPMELFLILLNLPIIILGFINIKDKRFMINSSIGIGLNTLAILVTKPIAEIKFFDTSNMLLSAIFGGVVLGIGMGTIIRHNGSFGGIETLSIVLKNKLSIEFRYVILTINTIIVLIGSIRGGFQIGLYTLISIFIYIQTMNKVVQGLSTAKLFLVVSEKKEEIASVLKNDLGISPILIDGEGAVSGKDKDILYCVIQYKEWIKIKQLILNIDEKAFISILDTSEVQGKGFKKNILN